MPDSKPVLYLFDVYTPNTIPTCLASEKIVVNEDQTFSCADVDECAAFINPCGHGICTNTIPDYSMAV